MELRKTLSKYFCVSFEEGEKGWKKALDWSHNKKD